MEFAEGAKRYRAKAEEWRLFSELAHSEGHGGTISRSPTHTTRSRKIWSFSRNEPCKQSEARRWRAEKRIRRCRRRVRSGMDEIARRGLDR